MSGMSSEMFAEYVRLEAAKKQRVVDYIEELNEVHAEHREAKAVV